ncbi:MAG: thiamine pyrophosphate-binding protein [Ramlibacter sp.]|uniref:thiamine pyrophosphate-binding protein n=1 Tax=Ramlibacter sp. TaxID=1917967 RepID=UPI002634A720|nr:thiamine pyrophosphate-binding protein [Ramlibacter sp.]MDH4375682.1 thiamine pyrophosphate-binding protein [Ramlibacter sp.]
MNLSKYSIPATAMLERMKAAAIDHFVTVPDWVQMSLHQQLETGSHGIRQINAASENQCVTMAAGLTLGGKKPLVSMQNQGLYNCVNTLRAVCLDAHIPLVFLVGQFGREYANLGQDSRLSRRTMVRVMEPMLDALDIPYFRLERPTDLGLLDQAYEVAQQRSTAAVILLGAPMSWS